MFPFQKMVSFINFLKQHHTHHPMFDYTNMGKAIMPIQIWIYAHDYVYAIHSLSNHALLVCISPTFPDPIVFWRSPDWAKRAQVSVLKKKKNCN